jgi:hypothetical protein
VLFAVLFKAFDADKSGFIQKDEMAAVLKMLYLNGLKALNSSTVHEVFLLIRSEAILFQLLSLGNFRSSLRKILRGLLRAQPVVGSCQYSRTWTLMVHQLWQRSLKCAFTGDQKLSYADFKKFTQSQPKITVQLNGFKKELPVGLI